MKRIGILGGSFNPVHIGHLRLALEACEALATDRTDLLPCALPPHKEPVGILPLEFRLQLLEAAAQGVSGVHINPLEGERTGPSYTWDSLQHYRRQESDAQLFFLLGCEDFAALPDWRNGLELPTLAHFVVVPRDGSEEARFLEALHANWPQSVPCASGLHRTPPGARFFRLPAGTELMYLPLPRLDISASLIRSRFLSNLDIRFLLPDAVRSLLEAERKSVTECWRSPA